MRPSALLTPVALLACLVAVGSASGTAGDPTATAKAYVNAYNKHDGTTMCKLFSPELRGWFNKLAFRPGMSCAKIATARIGYGEESDTPTFQRLTILSANAQVSGDTAQVTVRARYRFKHFPKPITTAVTDQIYLANRDGRWGIVKPGGVWFYTQSAYNIPENTLDPPIGDAEARQAAPQPAASFECAASAGSPDPAGDAPASLDVRSAGATLFRAGTDGTYGDETDGTVSPSYLAGYDSTSGLAYGAGGSPLQLRQSGGQAQALGKDSWTWLLLGPMSR